MKELNNINLDELRPDGDDNSGLINELTEQDERDCLRDQEIDTASYSLKNKEQAIFSPQIEVFEPFGAHVDASRTNMSAKQLLQLVTSENNDLPFILNKNYKSMTDINSPFMEFADEDGIVLHSAENILVIYYLKSKTIKDFYLPASKKLVNNSLLIKYKIGQQEVKTKFKKGDLLYDYSNQHKDSHVPRVGYRTNIMMASFYGYTAEDAFVASESYANRATIDYSKKILIPISKELKYLKNDLEKYFYDQGDISGENLAKYFKIDSSDSILSEFNNTSTKQSKIFGKSIDTINGATINKIKVHKINKDDWKVLEDEYIYTPGLMLEIKGMLQRQMNLKRELFLNLNTTMEQDNAVILTNNIFSQWESTEKPGTLLLQDVADSYQIQVENIDILLEVELSKTEITCLGDKFANVYAGKGVCSLILPDELMPKDEHGVPCDIIFNPLGLFGRNNWGTVFEMNFAKMIDDIQSVTIGSDPTETINRIKFINDHFFKRTDPEYYGKINDLMYWLQEDCENWNLFKKDVITNGLYLYVGNFPKMKYYDFINEFILGYEKSFNMNITKKIDTVYSKELINHMRDKGFTSSVFNKVQTEDVPQKVFFGKNYWIKLYHTSFSKYNAISSANSYSKTTGEPNRGRKNGGGVHLSWQSSAAIEGHKEGNRMMDELNTIKSTANSEKGNFMKKMINDGQYYLKDHYTSPVMHTLNNALHMIGMKFSQINIHRDDEYYTDEESLEEDYNIDDLFEGISDNYIRDENDDVFIDKAEDEIEYIKCPTCKGEGFFKEDDDLLNLEECSTCYGKGKIQVQEDSLDIDELPPHDPETGEIEKFDEIINDD